MFFILINGLFDELYSLPWRLYSTFVIEEKQDLFAILIARHGFNKQTLGLFFKDMVKNLLLSFIVSIPLYLIVSYVLNVVILFFVYG